MYALLVTLSNNRFYILPSVVGETEKREDFPTIYFSSWGKIQTWLFIINFSLDFNGNSTCYS